VKRYVDKVEDADEREVLTFIYFAVNNSQLWSYACLCSLQPVVSFHGVHNHTDNGTALPPPMPTPMGMGMGMGFMMVPGMNGMGMAQVPGSNPMAMMSQMNPQMMRPNPYGMPMMLPGVMPGLIPQIAAMFAAQQGHLGAMAQLQQLGCGVAQQQQQQQPAVSLPQQQQQPDPRLSWPSEACVAVAGGSMPKLISKPVAAAPTATDTPATTKNSSGGLVWVTATGRESPSPGGSSNPSEPSSEKEAKGQKRSAEEAKEGEIKSNAGIEEEQKRTRKVDREVCCDDVD